MKPVLIYYEILGYTPENLALLNDRFEIITLTDPSQASPPVLQKAEVILAPLGYFCGKQTIDHASKLKIIGSNTTGHPHIDVGYARSKGIRVITLKNQHKFLKTITPTAELTWGLIIAVTRNIISGFQSVLQGKWSRWPFGGKNMLSRMSLGVVGYGRLGKKVASYGSCFGMQVGCFDPYIDRIPKAVKRFATLADLVSSSDIITVHVPHEPETENMFSRRIFAKFQPGAYFINTSRGELVDQDALLEALEKKILAGAAIDVLADEFKPDFQKTTMDHPLIKYASTHSNLIITPHIGGSTQDAWHLTQAHTIELILEALHS
jgi:D-3-phosphoglycerate dehydrogenase / 2-oxoglutarate reductase